MADTDATVKRILTTLQVGRGSQLMPVSAPVVMVPIEVASTLRGLVVVPPRRGGGGMFWDVGRLLSIPGLIVLLIATGVAAALIVGPARRRLRDLENATARLGSGDLSARASEQGGDEVARLAQAFNRMAAELAARGPDLWAARGAGKIYPADGFAALAIVGR